MTDFKREHDPVLVDVVAKAFWAWNLEDHPDAPTWDEVEHEGREQMRDGAMVVLDAIRAHEESLVVLSFCLNHPETPMPITGVVHSCTECGYTETHRVDGQGAIHADH